MTVNLNITQAKYNSEGLDNFFWPVDRHITILARNVLTDNLMDLLRTQLNDPLAFSTRMFAKWFLLECMHLLKTISISSAFRDAGVDLVFPKSFRMLESLRKGQCPLSQQFLNLAKSLPGSDNRYFAKRMAREWQWNHRPLKLLLPFRYDSDVMTILPTRQTIMRARSLRRYLRYSNITKWFDPLDPALIIKSVGVEHSGTFQALIDLVGESFHAGGQHITIWCKDYLASWFTQSNNFATYFMEQLDNKHSSLPREYWSGSVIAQPWLRLLSYAIRENGGKVTVHEHGTGNQHFDQTVTHLSNYAGCDEFCASTTASRLIKLSALRPELFFTKKPPKFINLPEEHNASSKSGQSSRIIIKQTKIQKVLYVPTLFYGEISAPYDTPSDIVYLDWWARLLGFLGANGKQVVVKPHPEGGLQPPWGFAESFGFRTNNQKFEDMSEEIDAYLIDYIASSTTTPILKSDKPVIFIDVNTPRLLSKAKDLIEKRCWYIPAWDDDDNRLQIDWDLLAEAINSERHTMDMTFPDSYLVSSKII